ncbi:hypothetical protein ACFO3M_19255, partial [Geodermatophilus arenarius]
MADRAAPAVQVLLAVLGVVTVAGLLTGAPAWLVPAALGTASAASAAALARCAARMPGRAGRPWWALSAAGALLALGQALALASPGRDLATGGVEDLPTLLGVPVAVGAAVLLLPPRSHRRLGTRVLLDGVVVTVAVALLGCVLLGDLVARTGGPGSGLIAAGHPLVGALLCGIGLVTLTAVPEARRRAAGWLLAAFVAMSLVAVGGALGRTSAGTAPGWGVVVVLGWLAVLTDGLRAARPDAGAHAVADAVRRTLPLRGGVL